MNDKLLIIGSGHLARRLKVQAQLAGYKIEEFLPPNLKGDDGGTFDGIVEDLSALNPGRFLMTYLVDDKDEANIRTFIALSSINSKLPITISLFNERVSPHIRAAHPNVRILNPARIAAPVFIAGLDRPVERALRYKPTPLDREKEKGTDRLITILVSSFLLLIGIAVCYFHLYDGLPWLDALYFVIVTVATVGYGDINLLNASPESKVAGIGLIILSTFFIWLIFSLTIDRVIKKRVELSLGRKRYRHRNHIILCGLGRLGYFIAEGILERGEKLIIIESNESSPAIRHFRNLGADVYIGDARSPRVLEDANVSAAKALLSVIDDDYVNMEVGLNARSFSPALKLILRIFDQSMSEQVRTHLDIHLTYSATSIAVPEFLAVLKNR